MSLILKSIILIPIFGLIVKSPELSCMIYDWEMVRSEHMSGHKNYWECLYQMSSSRVTSSRCPGQNTTEGRSDGPVVRIGVLGSLGPATQPGNGQPTRFCNNEIFRIFCRNVWTGRQGDIPERDGDKSVRPPLVCNTGPPHTSYLILMCSDNIHN